MIAYFQDGKGFIGVTKETPKGHLKGIVFVGRGPKKGGGIDTICEQGFDKFSLAKLKQVPADQVPDDWFEAIGLEKRVAKPEPVEVFSSGLSSKTAEKLDRPREIEITVELPGDRFYALVTAKKDTPEYYRWRRQQPEFFVKLVVATIIVWWLVFGRG